MESIRENGSGHSPPDPEATTSPTQLVDEASKSSIDVSFAGLADDNCSSRLEKQATHDVCEEVLDSKMAALELSEGKIRLNGDGSDSGVEIGGLTINASMLQRALSSNSGGYVSSSGGGDDGTGFASCNSSMISYSSDLDKAGINLGRETLNPGNSYCASEGGSESSSMTGGPTMRKLLNNAAKKKVAVKEPSIIRSPRKSTESNASSTTSARSRSRGPTITRSNTIPKTYGGPPVAVTVRDRARSRDKMTSSTKSNVSANFSKSAVTRRPPKPDSLGIKDIASPMQRSIGGGTAQQRTPSRGRTPLGTPGGDDGRWPSVTSKSAAGTPKSSKTSMLATVLDAASQFKARASPMTSEHMSIAEKYATLPRRRKQRSVEDLTTTPGTGRSSRSESTTRESIPARMTTSLVRKSTSSKESTPSKPALSTFATPKSKRAPQKTRIYHETGVQTAITSKDVEDAFAGKMKKQINIEAIEKATKATQSDIRDREIEKLQDQLKKVNGDYTNLLAKLSDKSQAVSHLEQQLLQEKEEKLAVQKELQNNTDRVVGMLQSFHADADSENGGGDSLMILESQLQMSGNILEKQQDEIIKLQSICRSLQRDMEKSLAKQENLIRQRNELEEESNELQDFLQAEKMAFVEALKEAEDENKTHKVKLAKKDVEIERLQDECRHLVRACEQRRQEYLGAQTKYSALENRSKDLIMQQSSAVSSASVALTGLGARLNNLVDELITSYSISAQELEDVVYHNEAYTQSSCENSPDDEVAPSTSSVFKSANDPDLTPERGRSFIAAIINAIRGAATSTTAVPAPSTAGKVPRKHSVKTTTAGDESDSTEMLDSETEPCLMMDHALEYGAMQDSQLMPPPVDAPPARNDDDLNNLSQAITNRQNIELQTCLMAQRSTMRQASNEHSLSDEYSGHESLAELPSLTVDYYSAQTIVDQVIEVDNLVTKLLKVLRLVQLDNESCVQDLINDKNRATIGKGELVDRVQEFEKLNAKLQVDLKEASQQLLENRNELTTTKTELQRHRMEIDRLNNDVCELSTLCSDTKGQNRLSWRNKDELLALLKTLQSDNSSETQELTEILTALTEVPMLKEKLHDKDRQLSELSNSRLVMTASFHQALSEAKRQYDAIDRALEILNNFQSVVEKYPALHQLQQDLEECNFQSASSLPITPSSLGNCNGNRLNLSPTPDMNANSAAGLQLNSENSGNHPIDSTA